MRLDTLHTSSAQTPATGKEAVLTYLLSAAIAIAVLMQFPGSRLDPANSVAWAVVFLASLAFAYYSARISGFLRLFVGCAAAAFCASSVSTILFGVNAFSPVLIVLVKSLLVYAVGYLLPFAGVSERGLSRALVVYVAAVLILAAQIRTVYFPSFSGWFSQVVYAYGSKNSAAQIIAVAVILLVFFFVPRNKVVNGVRVGLACLLGAFLFLIQSRAAIVALATALALYLIPHKRGRYLIVPLLGLVALTIQIPGVEALLDRVFLVSKYAAADVDAFSSGRITVWLRALDVIRENLLFGTGQYYVDNLYINVLANVGVVGAMFVFAIWATRIAINLSSKAAADATSQRVVLTLRLLTVFYVVESLFEGLPPFGPGVSSLVFWILCGFYDGTLTAVRATGPLRDHSAPESEPISAGHALQSPWSA